MPFRNILNGKEFSKEMLEGLVKFKVLVDKRLPEKVEVELEKVIVESFDNEAYQDKQKSKWKGRKSKKDDDGRKLLVKTGALKRSIEVTRNGSEIKASTDSDYAQVHNEGGKAGRGQGFDMPKRQFMPKPGEENQALDQAVEKWLDAEMDKIFK